MRTNSQQGPGRTGWPDAGFTLVEMMFVAAIFTTVILGIVSLQLYGLRIYNLGTTMMTANTSARQAMNSIRDNVRSAQSVMVGSYYATNGLGFTQASLGSLQQGNALAIEFTNTASTNYIVYYQNSAGTNICCFSNNAATAYTNTSISVVAKWVTNSTCFYYENYQGTVQTNFISSPVIHILMQMTQWQYGIIASGTNPINEYNNFALNTRVTPRQGF